MSRLSEWRRRRRNRKRIKQLEAARLHVGYVMSVSGAGSDYVDYMALGEKIAAARRELFFCAAGERKEEV